MHIVVIAICIILWLIIQKSLADQGVEPLSLGQLRYMRRKARRMGVDVSAVPYRPRKGTHPFKAAALDARAIENRAREIEREHAKEQSGEKAVGTLPDDPKFRVYKRSDWNELADPEYQFGASNKSYLLGRCGE